MGLSLTSSYTPDRSRDLPSRPNIYWHMPRKIELSSESLVWCERKQSGNITTKYNRAGSCLNFYVSISFDLNLLAPEFYI
jgi:hypothetical protein